MAGYPAAGSPPIVTVLTPGAAPRTALRYQLAAGQKGVMDMVMTMGMTMNMAGQTIPVDLPPMRLSAALDVTSVATNGDITYNLAFTKMSLDPGGNPQMEATFAASAAGITSVKGVATVSNRGVARSTKLDLSAVTDPNMKQTLSQMTTSIENLSMPLPEEAVGAGARWDVRYTLTNAGFVVFQRIEYELISVNGPEVALKVKLEQTAPPQPVVNPDMPPGVDSTLDKMSGSGTGTVTIRLDSIVPTSSMDSTTSTAMNISMGGQSQSMGMDMKLKLSIAPGVKK
jgi:hypothetical protein